LKSIRRGKDSFTFSEDRYFDVRTLDKWVRVHVKRRPHDFARGIYHFTCDEDRLIHAMRLFIGQPFGRLLIVPGTRVKKTENDKGKGLRTGLLIDVDWFLDLTAV
jgi:cupin superfamily acireductone dioxygenase involved in methionine salvage